MSRKPNLATHFYLEPDQIQDNHCTFSREESDHLLKTFRLAIGDVILATDGAGNLYDVHLTRQERGAVGGEIVKVSRLVNELDIQITVAFGLSLQAKTDQIIDQCTQLGVAGFVPLITEQSQLKLDEERAQTRLGRWRKVAISAMKQSLRTQLPWVNQPQDLGSLIKTLSQYDAVLLASLHGGKLERTLALTKTRRMLLLTGSEQGFSAAEEDALIQAGAVPISLGERRLRAELAPVVLTSLVLARLGCDPVMG